MRTIGPYRAGEVPGAITVVFRDAAGNPINITGFSARWVWARNGGTPVERTATISDGPAGKATYSWVGADLDTSGSYRAEMWIGNLDDRYASELFAYHVEPALAVPAI